MLLPVIEILHFDNGTAPRCAKVDESATQGVRVLERHIVLALDGFHESIVTQCNLSYEGLPVVKFLPDSPELLQTCCPACVKAMVGRR